MKMMKNMSRTERTEYFKSHKSELLSKGLETVNGGVVRCEVENPNSEEIPYKGNWISSDGSGYRLLKTGLMYSIPRLRHEKILSVYSHRGR